MFDAESANVQGLWSIEKVRRRIPDCPLLVYTGSKQWEWEEEAYLQGVSHVLTKPVRGRLLNEILARLWSGGTPAPATPVSLVPVPMARSLPAEVTRPAESPVMSPVHTVTLLRDFSAILT